METDNTAHEYVEHQTKFNNTITEAILKLDKGTRTQHKINQANIEVLRDQDTRITTDRKLIIINLLIAITALATAVLI